MNERIARLRDKTIAMRPSLCWERGKIITDSMRSSAGEPQAIRRALALEAVLEKMTLVVDEDELIVGNQACRINAAPLFPEFSVNFLLDEIDSFEKRPYDGFTVDAKTKEVIREIVPFWRGQTHEEKIITQTRRVLPPELLPAWEEGPFRLNDILYDGVRKSAGDGHVIVDYDKILAGGIKGILDEAHSALAALDYHHDVEAFKKKNFLDSVVISFTAVSRWFIRYADEAEKISRHASRPENKETLLAVAQNCRNLAHNAPATFHEAVQLAYFIHLLLHIESNGHSVSLGRMDQYLYPFYARDIGAGKLTRDKALALIDCLYIKISKFNKVRPWPETRNKSGAPMFMTLTLAGQTKEGKDASNDLSYLFLDALMDTRMPQPTVVLRVAESTPEALLTHAAHALMVHGGGLPAFFSDVSIYDALDRMAVPREHVHEYAICGCSEAVIPGKTFSFTGGDCYFNFLKVLEVLLHEGMNPRTGIRVRPTKKLEEYGSIQTLLHAYQEELAFYMSLIVPLTAISSATDAELNPTPFTSGCMSYRIGLGKCMSEGGGENAEFSHTILQGHGTADVSNALYTIEKLVFQDKSISLKELVDVLSSNWAGEKGQKLRDTIRLLPKYGNDQDAVDKYAMLVSNMFAAEAEKYTPWRGGKFGVSLQGLTANVPEGETVGATPDGRVASEAISDNISPHAGTDLHGPTATLNSVAKVDHARFVDGNILNLRFHPSALMTPKGEFDALRGKRFAQMIQTYLLDLKGNQLQFNIVSADVLRKAQQHPEENRDLIVKVAGYSAYFASLDKLLQDQIIERTEHVL